MKKKLPSPIVSINVDPIEMTKMCIVYAGTIIHSKMFSRQRTELCSEKSVIFATCITKIDFILETLILLLCALVFNLQFNLAVNTWNYYPRTKLKFSKK